MKSDENKEMCSNWRDAIDFAHHEAKRCFSKRLPDELKREHHARLMAICETLAILGVVKDSEILADEIWEFEYMRAKERGE